MLIKNAKIYNESLKDIEIKNGLITQIAECGILQDSENFDASNLSVLPAFVDLNVRLKNDHFSLQNLQILENECKKGGVSAILLRDSMDFTRESFALFLEHLKTLKVQILPSIKAVDKDKKIKDLSSLINKGANFLEIASESSPNSLRQAMLYASMKDVPCFVYCYESGFDDVGVMNESQTSFELGLSGMSEVAELSEVARMKELEKFYKTKLVYEGVSLAKSLDLLENALTQVSIHHLIKDDSECMGFNTAAKLMPPLRSDEDVEALKSALKKGKISFLSSLHSPKSISLKDLAFDEAAFGIHSICEYVSLCYTFLVKNGFLSWRELCKFTSLNPAKFLDLNSGEIAVGKEANLIFFDESTSFYPNATSLYAKDELFGEVKAHFIKGERVF